VIQFSLFIFLDSICRFCFCFIAFFIKKNNYFDILSASDTCDLKGDWMLFSGMSQFSCLRFFLFFFELVKLSKSNGFYDLIQLFF